ncbi:MAG: hemolysin family protein [Myxococcales bacterium]|nr:hemolysin family protein [Myxococcales bacterium]
MDTAHAHLDAIGVAWRLGATLFFVLLNGFFVATEFALVKVRMVRIDTLARDGSRRARAVQHILSHLDRYLSACQLGITFASLILGALGEPAVSVLIVAGLDALGIDVAADAKWLPIVSIALAFTLITVLHMTLGEQAPKMWALRRAETTALRTAFALRVFTWVFGPFIAMINGISNSMLRVAGIRAHHGHDVTHTSEEIRSMLALSWAAGHISKLEHEVTENVFRIMELEVRHIVLPRSDVEFLSLNRPDDENLAVIRDSGHSRLPLCEVGLDTVVGFVHNKDVLQQVLEGKPLDLASLARKAIFVPDTMSLSNFLVELQSGNQHCAAVVDERGTVIGLAFREDALEEIVGPLGDEFDVREQAFRKIDEGVYEIAGRMSVPEACDRLDFELGDDEYEDEDTIGGHVTARLGRLAKLGDQVPVGPYLATVTDVGRRRVRRVRLERKREEEETGTTSP